MWCQGGSADGWRYETLIEPPETIWMLRDPFHGDQWIRVVGDWPQAIAYERVRSVEQIDGELIYYPAPKREGAL